MIDEAVAELSAAMDRRCIEYIALVQALRHEFPDVAFPAERIEQLLMDAYRDGGRDMYAAVNKTLAPLWKHAGIEP